MPVSRSSLNYAHGASISPRGGGSRWIGLATVIAVHAAVVVALLSYQPVREALGMKPLMVEFITPPAPPAPQPPKEIPRPPEVKVVKKVIEPPEAIAGDYGAGRGALASGRAASRPPTQAAAAGRSRAAGAAGAAAAPPSQPRVVSGVEYLRPPEPVYPPLARRMNEQGKVILRVLVNPAGHAEKADIQKSSGSSRLDEAARTAVMGALFKPYLENGQAVAAQVNIPITFSLSD